MYTVGKVVVFFTGLLQYLAKNMALTVLRFGGENVGGWGGARRGGGGGGVLRAKIR